MDNNNVAIAALTLTGTLAAGFFALIAKQNKTHEKLARSIDLMAKASKEVAKATVKSAQEAEQRNGHLGEQSLKLATLITDQNKDVVSIKNSTAKTAEVLSKSALIAAEDRSTLLNPTQHIAKQVVDKQIVKEK